MAKFRLLLNQDFPNSTKLRPEYPRVPSECLASNYSTEESEDRGRSCDGSRSNDEELEELRAYQLGSSESEDEVSVWWKQTYGQDKQGEGRALREPWYSWKLWDRERKWRDRQQPDAEAEKQAALAEENKYQNSREASLEVGTSRCALPSGSKSSALPSGSKSSALPSGSKSSALPSESKRSALPSRENTVHGVTRLRGDRAHLSPKPQIDLDEATSLGSQVKEPLGVRRIIVPRGSLSPGEVIKLAKTGIQISWESDSESEEEPSRSRVKTWRTGVQKATKEAREKTWRSDTEAESTTDESKSSTTSEAESEDYEVKHKATYLYSASTLELLERGLSPKHQHRLATAVLKEDRKSYNDIIFEVNTKYKPVGKKILPIPIALPTTDNPPLRRPPLSRDPYQTPLKPNMPRFVPGGKLSEERIALLDFGPEGWLSDEERNLILMVLRLREKSIAFDGKERGKLKESYGDPYKIPVVPHVPWRQSALPIPLAAREKIIETFKLRMEEGIYENSTSAYSGRWFVVAKKDGKYRIVHDLQPLNGVTIRDAGLPPVMEDFIEDFTGRACLGLMDVYGGFDQRELAPESRDLTTFQTPLGPKRLTRLPTGATNSVAEYQRVMVHVLAEEIPEYAGVFVDDVGIKGPTSIYDNERIPENPGIRRFVWEYAITLERVLFRFEEAGLTVSGPKAAAIVPALNIVGTVCSIEGRRMSKATKNKVANFPVPINVSEVRGFLGICTYVRIWIEKFADIARPIRDLTRNGAEFIWTTECQESFEQLKQIVGKDLLLAKIEYGAGAGKIILAVDSSQVAAGGVIFQEDSQGKRRPARYESLTFTETESRYSQPKLELAGVAKMLKKLQMFLWGQHFILEVDASALVQMINAPELPNAPMNRWLRFIQLFDFEIVHVPGKKHTLADGLSRARRDEFDEEARDLDSLISAHVELQLDKPIYEWQAAFVEADYKSDKGLLAIGKYLSTMEPPIGLSKSQWYRFQMRAMGFALVNGRLYRRRGGMLREVVLDTERQEKFLMGVHDETGHRGREETARRVSERAWWPGWSQTVKQYVKTCDECQRRKPNQEREARNPSMSAGFFRKFNMDVTHIKEGAKPYLLTAREDLTGWVEGRALAKITSLEVAKFISEVLIPRFGWFYQATLDGGTEFKGEVIKALREFGIRRIVIAPYHPEANGMEERGHQPLVDCLIKISDTPKSWGRHLPMVLFADRISMRRTTGMTPFAMLYGTEAVLPIDQNEDTWIISDWKDEKYTRSELLRARFAQLERKSDLLIKAAEKLKAARLASVLYHDRVNAHRLRDPLKEGVLVLVHNAKLDTLHGGKFLPRWTGPYRVSMRLKKGSYLLEELDGTRMKRVYAARRVRRYYPRGRKEADIFDEELPEANEGDEEVWDGIDGVPIEDIAEGEKIIGPIIGYTEAQGDEQMDVDNPAEDQKPEVLIDLPEEELRSLDDEEQLFEERERDIDSESEESAEEEEPEKRARRVPDRYMNEGWNLHAKKSTLKMTPFANTDNRGSSDEEVDHDVSAHRQLRKRPNIGSDGSGSTKENEVPPAKTKLSAKAQGKQREVETPNLAAKAPAQKFWVEIRPRKAAPRKPKA
ncbi:hypothetical protein P7C70_g4776, partial [Phenoliferia sp. Uapishka_3]